MPPHRAMFSDNKYYTRAGDSFIMMEHHMLEDSFGRRQKPKLDIYHKLVIGASSGNKHHFSILFGIKNTGKYVATYPAIKIVTPNDLQLYFPSYSYSAVSNTSINLKYIPTTKEGGDWFYAGGNDDVIHPNTQLDVSTLVPIGDWIIKDGLIRLSDRGKTLSFSYEIFAEGCSSVKGVVEFTADEILDFLRI